MDATHEKKWFVYMKDHHDGPFSLNEIEGQMSGGAVSPASYVWAEGMSDWTPMNTVSAFQSLIQGGPTDLTSAPAAEPSSSSDGPAFHANEASLVPSLEPSLEPSVEPVTLAQASPAFELQPFSLEEAIQPTSSVPEITFPPDNEEPRTARRSRAGLWLLVIILLLVGGIPIAYIKGWLDPILANPTVKSAMDSAVAKTKPELLALAQKYPALQKWISPIPPLSDVTPEEYADLQKTAMAAVETGPGSQATLALSRADLMQPSFYVSSNAIVERTEYDLFLEGVGDTLLNQTSFFGKTRVVVAQHLGKSESIKNADGRPLARGQYKVSIAAASKDSPLAAAEGIPHETRVISSRTYFLGGANDAMYLTRLKEFHDKLQAKAATELQELTQLESTLESQLNSTNAEFDKIRAGKMTAAKKLKWNEFNSKWQKLAGNIAQNYPRWSSPGVQNEYFHGELYSLALQAAQGLEKLHQTQLEFTQGKSNKSSVEIQLGQVTSVAQNTVASLKTKIEKATATPPTPGGLPQKEATTP